MIISTGSFALPRFRSLPWGILRIAESLHAQASLPFPFLSRVRSPAECFFERQEASSPFGKASFEANKNTPGYKTLANISDRLVSSNITSSFCMKALKASTVNGCKAFKQCIYAFVTFFVYPGIYREILRRAASPSVTAVINSSLVWGWSA